MTLPLQMRMLRRNRSRLSFEDRDLSFPRPQLTTGKVQQGLPVMDRDLSFPRLWLAKRGTNKSFETQWIGIFRSRDHNYSLTLFIQWIGIFRSQNHKADPSFFYRRSSLSTLPVTIHTLFCSRTFAVQQDTACYLDDSMSRRHVHSYCRYLRTKRFSRDNLKTASPRGNTVIISVIFVHFSDIRNCLSEIYYSDLCRLHRQ